MSNVGGTSGSPSAPPVPGSGLLRTPVTTTQSAPPPSGPPSVSGSGGGNAPLATPSSFLPSSTASSTQPAAPGPSGPQFPGMFPPMSDQQLYALLAGAAQIGAAMQGVPPTQQSTLPYYGGQPYQPPPEVLVPLRAGIQRPMEDTDIIVPGRPRFQGAQLLRLRQQQVRQDTEG